MDTSDLGKLNTLNTLQVARRGLDKASCLNEVHSIPRCSEQQQSSLQKKKNVYIQNLCGPQSQWCRANAKSSIC